METVVNRMAFFHGHTHADYECKKQIFPIISIGCNKYVTIPSLEEVLALIQPTHPSINNLQCENLMELAKKHHIKVHDWIANSDEEYKRLFQMGVDAVITNYPDRCRKVMDVKEK